MNTPLTPWFELAVQQAQRWHRLAWFLYGCLEREHLLNMQALVSPRARERRHRTSAPSTTAVRDGGEGPICNTAPRCFRRSAR